MELQLAFVKLGFPFKGMGYFGMVMDVVVE
jgi:hypothetical protein